MRCSPRSHGYTRTHAVVSKLAHNLEGAFTPADI